MGSAGGPEWTLRSTAAENDRIIRLNISEQDPIGIVFPVFGRLLVFFSRSFQLS